MGILAWIVLGLIAGLIARALYPGDQPGGVIVTMLLGIAGAFLGGWISGLVTGDGGAEFSFMGVVWAVIGAVILLWLYSMVTRRRHHPSAS